MADLLRTSEQLQEKLDKLNAKMSDPKVLSDAREMRRIGRDRNRITKILASMESYRKILGDFRELGEVIGQEDDAELVQMARDEHPAAKEAVEKAELELKLLLTPKDPSDSKNAVVEIRAGTGGDEATLFVRDIFRMYSKFSETHGLKLEEMSSSSNELGGLREIIFLLAGEDAYGTMKFESGVHRVQRVPSTEASGRIHTSAISVAVLPEAEDVDIAIDENDLKIDVFRSSGPGGQSVNTTDSAVRIRHIPTDLVVQCQDERSQLKNKAKAMKILRTRLLDLKQAEAQEATAEARRSMVSTGDRSAKIRTYNFPQGRVTDHRIGLTLYNLPAVMEGDLVELIQALALADSEARLQAESVE